MFLIVLVLLFLPRLGSAETLLCPILDTPEGADFSRAAALQTTPALYEALATETGRSPTETPWSDETEVTTGRTAANQLRLTIGAWGQLSPAVRQAILATGCHPVAADFGTVAREPRNEGGVLTYDQNDTTRPVIHPTRHGHPPNPRSFLRDTPRWRDAWRDWGTPRTAWALSDAPTTPLLSTCPSAQNPLAGGWASTQVLGDTNLYECNASGQFQLSGAQGGIAGGIMWTTTEYASNQEAYMTLPAALGVLRLFLGVQGNGTAGAVGYACSHNGGILAIQRFVGGTGTTVGTTASLTIANGQTMSCRRHRGTLYINGTVAGVWQTPIARGPDGTYTGPGLLGMSLDSASARTEDFGGGAVPQPRSLGRYLLGR